MFQQHFQLLKLYKMILHKTNIILYLRHLQSLYPIISIQIPDVSVSHLSQQNMFMFKMGTAQVVNNPYFRMTDICSVLAPGVYMLSETSTIPSDSSTINVSLILLPTLSYIPRFRILQLI